MDYLNVEPDYYVAPPPNHWTPGRGGHKIEFITRHHLMMVGDAHDARNVWLTRPASAHYVVDPAGKVGQVVFDKDTAWANADWSANQRTIAIEHSNSAGASADWPISDATIVAGARLAAALCLFYNLGRPKFGTNIRDHREFTATQCPYHLAKGGKYHRRWMDEAQRFYDELTAGKVAAESNTKEALVGTELSGVSAAALNDTKLAAQATRDLMVGPVASIVNPAVGFTLPGMIAAIDYNTWCTRRLVEAMARAQGLNPEQIIHRAIEADREATK